MSRTPEVDVALVYPPTCDPTAPYLAVPMLTGFLRAHGMRVLPVDANVEAFDHLLEPGSMHALEDRLEARLATLEAKPALAHEEQLELAALLRVRTDAHEVPGRIGSAKASLRDQARFYDPESYDAAVTTIDAALRVVSATHHPLHLDFTAYRTPFGLTSMAEIARAGEPGADPFHGWVHGVLVPRLRASKAKVVGLSVCFPGQLQPAYAFALAIKKALPDVHVTCGGPGITQMMIRLSGKRLANALGPFDSACLFEGENTLLALVRAVTDGESLRAIPNVVLRDKLMGARWLSGHGMEDLKALPAPDFDGLPLDRYFSPSLVLPYDPTRGCYWGKCTFCHYGLAEVGTAKYRERDVDTIVAHLRALSEKHGTHRFYFSQDSVAPKTIVKLASSIVAAGLEIRWATDLKPEKYLTPERAETLRRAGAVACALGVESASPRVLKLIDKGAPVEVVGDVVDRLAGAGIAAEAMCFTDFPTETYEEALATLDFIHDRRDKLAVYIVGEFGLTHGSLVAQSPERFGIEETWALEGDELGLGLFFAPKEPWKTDDERADVDAALSDLSSGWALRPYPWAGAVSTAHTVMYYERFGPGVFRSLAAVVTPFEPDPIPRSLEAAQVREAEIWSTLVNDERRVSRAAYEALAAKAPKLRRAKTRAPVPGRRPSHAVNATRATRS